MIETALKAVFAAAVLTGALCWSPINSIESSALKQPDHAVAPYTVPMHLKGVVRYVTPDQDRWDRWAEIGFWGAFPFAFLAGAGMTLVDKRKKNSN